MGVTCMARVPTLRFNLNSKKDIVDLMWPLPEYDPHIDLVTHT